MKSIIAVQIFFILCGPCVAQHDTCRQIISDTFSEDWKRDSLGIEGLRGKYYDLYFSDKNKIKNTFPLNISETCVYQTFGRPSIIENGDDLLFLIYFFFGIWDKEYTDFQGTLFEIVLQEGKVKKYSVTFN